MAVNSADHPCFNAEVRHKTGRIHLPVAPRCNVQCNFCNRKFDCANESRPGVTTSVLKPLQALAHLEVMEKRVQNLSVVGIAGPGDPFANPEETMETLELTRSKYPDKLLCVSSNGLNILSYIPRLAKLNVSHVTITVNAVNPEIGAEVYEWVHFDKKTYWGTEGATLLLERQTEAVRTLKQYGMTVKINTVVIPRVNEHHIGEIAKYVVEQGADIQNCIPLIPVEGTPFGRLYEPSASNMRTVRAKTSIHIEQMTHCARCRADAVGLLGEDVSQEPERPSFSFDTRPYIAVATTDGISINQHLGRSSYLLIYRGHEGAGELFEKRSIASCLDSDNRWNSLAEVLSDCAVLLVSHIGQAPLQVLRSKGIYVEAVDGPINEIVKSIFADKPISENFLRLAGHCASEKGAVQ
ncbi:MAG: radical SAM protein [Mediterranea sp.]|jgi:nitrogen fixation protein NifB|nr:radical SAM protein [Mediterranea sp.]